MKKISSGYIESLWSAFGEGQSINGLPQGLNLSNEKSIDLLIEKVLRPYIEEHDTRWKIRVKDSMRFAISTYSPEKLVNLYESVLPQIEAPSANSIKTFYSEVYKRLFLEELPKKFDAADYEEISPYSGEIY